eukprot:3398115-Prymnesium_polylepis.1
MAWLDAYDPRLLAELDAVLPRVPSRAPCGIQQYAALRPELRRRPRWRAGGCSARLQHEGRVARFQVQHPGEDGHARPAAERIVAGEYGRSRSDPPRDERRAAGPF